MRYAALDIGSNSVKLVVAEPDTSGALRAVFDEVVVSRLAAGLARTGRLRKRAMKRTVHTVASLLERAGLEGPTDPSLAAPLSAIVTAPGRRARNGGDFIELLEVTLGIEATVVAAEREAELAVLATRRAFPTLDPLLMIDLGGASTELVRLGPGESKEVLSLDIGAVRLSEAWLGDDPPTPSQVARAEEVCRAHLEPVADRFKPAGRPCREAVLVSGTATTLASLTERREVYRSGDLHGAVVEAAQAAALCETLCQSTTEERRRLRGMDPRRADVIHGGALLVQVLFEALGVERFHISDRGPRWGLAEETYRAEAV
jgi:exopolyphosphatase/guanosine-5'-triphosphate,3'-diphosphate pyrophosphatase